MSVQMTFDVMYPCPTCKGSGRRLDRETGGLVPCVVCEASGSVPYDPADVSIPYGTAA